MTFGYNRDKFRVRSPVKSFRDLEVYQKTVQLSSEVESLGNTEMNKAAEAAAPLLMALTQAQAETGQTGSQL